MFGEGGKLIETAIGAMAIGTVARSFFSKNKLWWGSPIGILSETWLLANYFKRIGAFNKRCDQRRPPMALSLGRENEA